MTDQEIAQAVLAHCIKRRKVAFVIAKVAEAANVNYDAFFLRVEASINRLVSAGTLEAWGDLANWRRSEIQVA